MGKNNKINKSLDQSHFLQAKEVVLSWPKWKQEIACPSLNDDFNHNNDVDLTFNK